MSTTQLPKETDKAFKKNVYLLGIVPDGSKYWLEEASWDCSWYWGLGYVETYKGRPSRCRDIDSHQHFNQLWLSSHEGKFRHCLSDWQGFQSTLTAKEEWQLAELMATAYNLKQAAEVFGRGGSHYSKPDAEILGKVKNPKWVKEINEVMIPAVMAKVYALLTPTPSSYVPVSEVSQSP
jgi:hypothetical protein